MKPVWKTLSVVFLLAMLGTLGVRADAPQAQSESQPATQARGQMVQFSNGKETISGFVAAPAKAGRYPAVLVVPEWWGLTDWIKDVTSKLADQGFVALAVDLYGGKVTTDPAEAATLRHGLSDIQALTDLNGGIGYLSTRSDVDRSRFGVVGWSMGGGLALRLAIADTRIFAVCVVNYGPLPTDPNDLQQLWAPTLGNFGGQDGGVTAADAHAFEKTMKSLSNPPRIVDVKVYPDAGHGFMNPADTAHYRPDDAADAWARTVNFLSKHLK